MTRQRHSIDPVRALLINQHQEQLRQIKALVKARVRALWDALPAYRDKNSDDFVEMVAPLVEAGQVQVAEITSAYIAQAVAVMNDTPPLPVDVDVADVTAPRGVPASEVYQRPAQTVWTKLSDGVPYAVAVAAGATRLEQLLGIDLQLAQTHQARRSYSNSGVKYYRRVLTGRENCGLCLIASTQHYHSGDLSPIHPGCDCTTAPLPADTQRWDAMDGSWRVIDPELLEVTHDAARHLDGLDRGGRGPDYRKMLFIKEHNEYGPTLEWAKRRPGK